MRAQQKPVLVLGGGHSEIPIIRSAKELGYRVITTGNRPTDPGHCLADVYVSADFSDTREMIAVARVEAIVGVIAGANDFAAISAAGVADALDLPGHDSVDTAKLLHHKDRFRALLAQLKLPRPGYVTVTQSDDPGTYTHLRLPVIVKPVDLTGGKGMRVCQSFLEVRHAIEAALSLTRAAHVIVEEFMTGTHHGFTCFIAALKVGFWFADDEQYFSNKFLVGGTSTPSSLHPTAVTSLINQVERIATHLNLVDGLIHVQAIQTNDDVRIVELCRRCPGDLYPRFVALSTGFDFAAAVVASELGLPASPTRPAVNPRTVVRRCLMADSPGIVHDVELQEPVAARVVESLCWWKPGDRIDNHLVEKMGILFFDFGYAPDAWRLADDVGAGIRIDVR